MISIDGRMLDTNNRFHDFCNAKGIVNPFGEEQAHFNKRCHPGEHNGRPCTVIDPETEEDREWRKEWIKRRDAYLRLEHTFRLWDFHFWMPWEKFKWHLDIDKAYADVSIYLPCDCAERQCALTCAYFGAECPRMKEELKAPEILGFDGRWEF